ncbi:MAG: hypothetical protein KKH91_07580 [Elusimicrobia bacterium]|nr:hypothetical protein [Elusimicrobiota bacterium]MBU2614774.1 hypothetical protein [Elusimicrobiota bacterium]
MKQRKKGKILSDGHCYEIGKAIYKRFFNDDDITHEHLVPVIAMYMNSIILISNPAYFPKNP